MRKDFNYNALKYEPTIIMLLLDKFGAYIRRIWHFYVGQKPTGYPKELLDSQRIILWEQPSAHDNAITGDFAVEFINGSVAYYEIKISEEHAGGSCTKPLKCKDWKTWFDEKRFNFFLSCKIENEKVVSIDTFKFKDVSDYVLSNSYIIKNGKNGDFFCFSDLRDVNPIHRHIFN